ncbi:MAG: flagellar biosynthesis protein FlhA [Acidimicrobiales bacterium]
MKPHRAALAVPLAVILIVVMLVVPLPSFLLDFLITTNITFAMIVLVVAMRVKDPLEFSAFPSVLLIATMFRLALNVSATRLVLLRGYAGAVIESFGHFVVGGSVVVGLVIFLILFIIQFVVITNGAGRVAEVGARFTLDAMPGKQMAIDADLNAGHIDEHEARRRRSHIAREADFYGAMDGASKFVKGDSIAAVVITMINLLGGFVVGVVQKHLGVTQSIDTYSLLSVGDGLVSQIPALLMSVATGLVVTRSSNQEDFGLDLLLQLGRQGKALQIGGGVIGVLGLLPGLPKLPFLAVGATIFLLGRRADYRQNREVEQGTSVEAAPETPVVESDSAQVNVEALELELSLDLLDVVDTQIGGDLLDRIKGLRRKLAGELGVTLPPVRTRDNLSLSPGEYVIRVYEVEVGRGHAPAGRVLAMGDNLDSLPGELTLEPVFQIPAKWIPISARQQAIVLGATVVDRVSVIVTHLSEAVRRHAAELLSRQQVKEMLDALKVASPVVVEEMAQAQVSLGELQRVLRDLLEEDVPVRNLAPIIEGVVDRSRISKEPDQLLDAARSVLGASIANPYVIGGSIAVATIDAMSEERLLDGLRIVDGRQSLALNPTELAGLKRQVEDEKERATAQGFDLVLVCSTPLRRALRTLLRSVGCECAVLAVSEIPNTVRVVRIGTVNIDDTASVRR